MHTDIKNCTLNRTTKSSKDWLLYNNDIILKSSVIRHSNKHVNLPKPKAQHYKDMPTSTAYSNPHYS